MTIDEAVKHLEFSKKSYQNLIDNDTRIGEAVGKDTTGTWKADTSLATVYQTMRDTMAMAIRSLEAWEKVKAEITEIRDDDKVMKTLKYIVNTIGAKNHDISDDYSDGYSNGRYDVACESLRIIDKHLKEVEE